MKKVKFLLVAVLAMVMLGLTGCGGSKVDITNYITAEFSGINGQGIASCTVDSVGLEQALAGDKDGDISMEELEKLGWITEFEMSLTLDLDQDAALSNGDKYIVSISYDKDLAKEHKVTVTGETKEFTVEGLKDPIEVDAFASNIFDTESGVVLEYSNAAPVASLTILNQCANAPESLITYTADKTSDISNGDQITITAALPATAAEEGYVLKETEKTITVEGLDTYVTSLAQLSDADREDVETQLQKTFDDAAASAINFHSTDGVNRRMYADSTATYAFENLTFLDDSYETGDYGATVIPFTVDIQMKGLDFWERPMDGITEKTFQGAYGYIVINDLRVDSDGAVVSEGPLSMYMGDIYETKTALDAELLQ